MGLKLVSSEWVEETVNERDSYKIGLERMQKEHDKALRCYRELRDSKDAEILNLHSEIESLKQDRSRQQQEIKRLRQAVNYYERRFKMEVLDEKEV